jgi:hypothetical protein
MKHQDPQVLLQTGQAVRDHGLARMSRRERIERWASTLENYNGPLNALWRIEYLPDQEMRAYRTPNSPMTIAFRDPVLREEGLNSDELGAAMDFFEMSDDDAHRLLCDCHYLGAMTGKRLASHLRRYAKRSDQGGFFGWLRGAFA